jgi:hypothetical protein
MIRKQQYAGFQSLSFDLDGGKSAWRAEVGGVEGYRRDKIHGIKLIHHPAAELNAQTAKIDLRAPTRFAYP